MSINGITNQFYKIIEEIVKGQTTSAFIATRTWSTNKTHIKILTDLGYKVILTIKNDRGKGLHTVYFAKEIISTDLQHYRNLYRDRFINEFPISHRKISVCII